MTVDRAQRRQLQSPADRALHFHAGNSISAFLRSVISRTMTRRISSPLMTCNLPLTSTGNRSPLARRLIVSVGEREAFLPWSETRKFFFSFFASEIFDCLPNKLIPLVAVHFTGALVYFQDPAVFCFDNSYPARHQDVSVALFAFQQGFIRPVHAGSRLSAGWIFFGCAPNPFPS